MKAGLMCSTSVDWLTVTTTNQDTFWDIKNGLEHLFDLAESEGDKVLEGWREKGYDGWKTRHMFVGQRGESEYIVRGSGHYAQPVFEVCRPYALRCTRIDVEVTAHPRDDDDRLADWAGYGKSVYNSISPKKPSAMWYEKGEGWTVYTNSRYSQRFMRIYRKDIQDLSTAWPLHSIRFEVQYTKPMSDRIFRLLQTTSGPVKMQSTIQSLVSDYAFEVSVPFLPFLPGRAGYHIPRMHAPTPTEKRLKWLETSVRPAVLTLFSVGAGKKALEALGLPYSEVVVGKILERLEDR